MKHATENGWEAFSVFTRKTDKATGVKTEEETEMLGSILHEGVHVYQDSITDKKPSGKSLIHKDAMSLSKHYWTPKDGKGSKEELYREFLSTYVEETVEKSTVESKVVKISAADKQKAAEEKKRLKDEESEKKREEKRLAKELKVHSKVAASKPSKLSKVPAAAFPTATFPTATPTSKSSKNTKSTVPATKKVTSKSIAWSCPDDDMVHAWSYKGTNYLRNYTNQVWARTASGTLGDWQGVYIVDEDRIDDSIPEPEYSDDDE